MKDGGACVQLRCPWKPWVIGVVAPRDAVGAVYALNRHVPGLSRGEWRQAQEIPSGARMVLDNVHEVRNVAQLPDPLTAWCDGCETDHRFPRGTVLALVERVRREQTDATCRASKATA